MEKINKCSCFEERFVADYVATRNAGFGDVLYRKECRCRGTKEQDVCSCGGDELKCDFYPDKQQPKSCPCCGGSPILRRNASTVSDCVRYYVICRMCGLRTGMLSSESSAIKNWNRREGERK